MNLQKLVSSIQREMTANPKKGLVLVLLLVASVYFWGPIIKRWGSTVAAKGSTIVIAQDDPLPAKKPEASERLPSWDKLELALASHELGRPLATEQVALLKNPFVAVVLDSALPAPEIEEEQAEPEQVIVAAVDLDPAQVGLVVKSVSIGPKGRLAYLRGRVFAVGDRISLADDTEAAATTTNTSNPALEPFELKQIESWGIVLTRNGKDYTQRLAQPRLKKFDSIAWGGDSEDDGSDGTD